MEIETLASHVGPVAIVALLAVAIVVSPVPSGPVALAAGAIYGPLQGSVLTIAGAVLGASIAFCLSRFLGRSMLVRSSAGVARLLTRERSQFGLMTASFLTSPILFIPFDAVSYVAGLTPIAFWRFVLATLAGTTPVCIAFAAAGAGATESWGSPLTIVLASAVTMLLPLAYLVAQALGRIGVADASWLASIRRS